MKGVIDVDNSDYVENSELIAKKISKWSGDGEEWWVVTDTWILYLMLLIVFVGNWFDKIQIPTVFPVNVLYLTYFLL